MTILTKLVTAGRAEGRTTYMTALPDGTRVIVVEADEPDPAGALAVAALIIMESRGEPAPKPEAKP